jgi:hypothetical protein
MGINDVKLEEGVLRFSSKDHLQNVIGELSKATDIVHWFPNTAFISLLQLQESITESDYDRIGETGELGEMENVLTFRGVGENKSLNKIIEDSRFAAVLNSSGFVIVADTAYKIEENQVLLLPLNSKNKLSDFLLNKESTEVIHKPIEVVLTTSNGLKNARLQDFTHEYDPAGGVKRRFIAEFIHTNTVVYHSLVVKIKHQKKNWVGWSASTAPRISFTASGTFWQGTYYQQFPFNGARDANNVDEQSYFVTESYGAASDWVYTAGNAYVVQVDGVHKQFYF